MVAGREQGREGVDVSHLWEIIQAHLDEYGVRDAALARRMGTPAQTLNSWKKRGLKQLPERRLLEAVARETRTPYNEVLNAVLVDTHYLEDTTDGRVAAPKSQAGASPAAITKDRRKARTPHDPRTPPRTATPTPRDGPDSAGRP